MRLRVTKKIGAPCGVPMSCGISSRMNIPSPCVLKASFQSFGWGMRTAIPLQSNGGEFDEATGYKKDRRSLWSAYLFW